MTCTDYVPDLLDKGRERERAAELERALIDVVERGARARGDAIAIPAEYLEVVAVRR